MSDSISDFASEFGKTNIIPRNNGERRTKTANTTAVETNPLPTEKEMDFSVSKVVPVTKHIVTQALTAI